MLQLILWRYTNLVYCVQFTIFSISQVLLSLVFICQYNREIGLKQAGGEVVHPYVEYILLLVQ